MSGPQPAVSGRLAGRVALITGAGTGIGRAGAIRFAAEGARVIVSEIDAASGEATAQAIRQAGGKALFVHTDVTDDVSVQACIATVVERFGRLDVLYNNAGGSTTADGPLTSAPLDEFWRAIRLDLYGTWLNCRHAIPHLIAAGGGAIINTSSAVALIAMPGMDCYTAVKGAIASLTRAMALEYAPHGIRVNAIAPGGTLTDRVRSRMKSADPNAPAMAGLRPHLLGFAEPQDIAATAAWLASADARKVTGQIISVDSGSTI